jgi:hypothetical protein
MLVDHLDGVAFYGNSALSLQIHVVKQLFLHLSLIHRAGVLQKTVGKSAFPVVNVSNYAKVADILHLYSIGIFRAAFIVSTSQKVLRAIIPFLREIESAIFFKRYAKVIERQVLMKQLSSELMHLQKGN